MYYVSTVLCILCVCINTPSAPPPPCSLERSANLRLHRLGRLVGGDGGDAALLGIVVDDGLQVAVVREGCVSVYWGRSSGALGVHLGVLGCISGVSGVWGVGGVH